ncbi:unnamed protein product [Rhizophagus irregularis]|nr:unnamed protein product [Rhizophagus irregularis]
MNNDFNEESESEDEYKEFEKEELLSSIEEAQKKKKNKRSPVTLAGKKGGNYRFCINYKKLNSVTKTDRFLLPQIDELLEKFRKENWFTSLYLAAGYHQVEMAEDKKKKKTTFIYSQELFEYNVIPFGLKNAPETFQRLIDKILEEYIEEFVTVYLNDIMIYSRDFKEHTEHVDKVLNKLRENNIIVKLKKCQFGLKNINFLEYIIGKDGLGVVLAQMNKENKETVIVSILRDKIFSEISSRKKIYSNNKSCIHRSGKKIKNADALSKLRFEEKVIKSDIENENQEIIKMDYNKRKSKYIKFKGQ